MSPKPLVANPPRGLLRLLFRLPIVLYRLKLGWLLGERFVLLNHVGRKSGKLYQTVVEVVGHDEPGDTYYIVSGWGYKSSWYQNLMATPDITIQVGRRNVEVHAETLPPVKGAQVLIDYRQQHPFAARELSRLMGLGINTESPQALKETIQQSLPVLALHVQNSGR